MRNIYTPRTPLSIFTIFCFLFVAQLGFGQNRPPIAVNFWITMSANTPVSDGLVKYAYDPDGNLDSNGFSLVRTPLHGTINIKPNGILTYSPNPNFDGVDSIIYKVCDLGMPIYCATATVVFDVKPIPNFAPIANNDTFYITANTTLNKSVALNDSDYNGNLDPNSFVTLDVGHNGIIIFNPNGSFTYSPNLNFTGVDSIHYKVCDLGMPILCSQATLIIVVQQGQNRAPLANNDNFTTTANTPLSNSVALNDSDPDGNLDTSSFRIIRNPLHGTITLGTNGRFNYSPTSNFNGVDSVDYKVCDLGSPVLCDTATVIFNVTKVVNRAPTPQNDVATTQTAVQISGTVATNDTDPDGNLDANSFLVVTGSSNAAVVFFANGNFTYKSYAGFSGKDSITYKVCDLGTPALCATAKLVVTVTPVSTATATISTPTSHVCVGGTVVLNGSVTGATGAVISAWEISTNGITFTTIAGAITNGFYPETTNAGVIFYRYVATSNSQTTRSAAFQLTVHPELTMASMPADQPLTYLAGTTIADADATFKVVVTEGYDTIRYVWASSVDGMTWKDLIENTSNIGTKTAILTLKKPNINAAPYYRVTAFTYGVGCDAVTSVAAYLSFKSRAANSALTVVTQPMSIEECVGGTLPMTVATTGGTGAVTHNWQSSTDSVNFTSVMGATLATFVPSSTAAGVKYYRCVVQSGTATVTSSVAKATVKPDVAFTLQPANVTLKYNTGNTFSDSSAFFKSFVTGATGAITYQWQCSADGLSWTSLSNSAAVLNATTTVLTLVKPKITEVPYYHLVVMPSGAGCDAATSSIATLTFQLVARINTAPNAQNDTFTTLQNVAVNGNLALNDYDTEGPLNGASFKTIKNVKNGSFTIFNGGLFNYTPSSTFIGTDTASYSVSDMEGLLDTAIVILRVVKGNHAPTLLNDLFKIKMNTNLTGTVATNDSDFDNNLNKNSFTVVSIPKNGNVKMWSDGRFMYLPKPNFVGRDTFKYQACDSLNLCSSAFVEVVTQGGFITGKIFYDASGNGLYDAGELLMPYELVTVDSFGKYFTNSKGEFQIPTDTSKTYVITPVLNNPLWTVAPLSKTVKTSNIFEQLLDNQSFAVRPASVVSDLAVNVEGGNARPGFSSLTIITYYNKGTTVLNGKVVLTLDNNQIYESTDVVMSAQSGNVLTWNISNLQPFESRNITVFVKTNVNAPLGNNVVYKYDASITGATDVDATNNSGSNLVRIMGSYDPNDITVDRLNYVRQPKDLTTPNVPLAYTIRFQNTGNAAAYRVEVLDTLNEKLDLTALEIVAASHKFEVQIVPDTNKIKKTYTVVKWIFDNINLLDSTAKEACSHGFVKYQIKNTSAKTNYVKDSILNKAAIYFDFNAPVLTNTAKTIFTTLTATSIEQINLEFKAFPNPTNGLVNIEIANETDATIEVYNNVGQLVGRQILRGSTTSVDMSQFANGLYILTVKTEKGSGLVKIFKD